jgi:hypothetical protein
MVYVVDTIMSSLLLFDIRELEFSYELDYDANKTEIMKSDEMDKRSE